MDRATKMRRTDPAPRRACIPRGGLYTLGMKIVSSVALGTLEPPKIFTAEELEAWNKPSVIRLICDLLGPWAQIAVSLVLVAAWNHPVAWIIAFLLIGGAQHALGLITHECGHRLIFPENRRLNDFLGTWIYGGASALPFRFYVDRHWDHHKLVSTEDDTKKLYRRNFSHWNIVKEILLGVSGYDYFYQVSSVLFRHKNELDKNDKKPTYVAEFAAVIFVQFAIFILFLALWGFWQYVFLWLLPLVTVASLFAKLRSAVEHQPLPSEYGHGNYLFGTELPVYRTVRARWYERLFLCRINFCYHIEHHLWPKVSYQKLPKVHERLFKHKKLPEPPGYFGVLKELWLQKGISSRRS